MEKNDEILNLAYNEKRLIILALIKTNGVICEAYKLNVPCGIYMNERTYFRRLIEYGIEVKKYKQKSK